MPSATTVQSSAAGDAHYLYHLHHAPRPPLSRHFSAGVEASDFHLTKVTSLEESISPLLLGKAKHVDDFKLDGTGGHSVLSKSSRRRAGQGSSLVGSPLLSSQHAQSTDNDLTASDHALSSKGSTKDILDILSDISSWIEAEREGKRTFKVKSKSPASVFRRPSYTERDHAAGEAKNRPRGVSDVSDRGDSLDQLEALVSKAYSLVENKKSLSRKPSSLHRRSTVSLRKLRSQSVLGQSDDTDSTDAADLHVPGCDAVLDNSKTMSYTGGASQPDLLDEKQLATKEDEAWASFKYEIVRLAHTLKLKGWRRVPMDRSNEISVERLSGALTNAVYVVSPPEKVPNRHKVSESGEEIEIHQRPPPKLLLRIYGPNVEHLIDRDGELQILRRLAKKKIGPRLLGTFRNGRFEEYLHAKTLQPQDLRIPDTSKQIAKRMRELHDGVELLDNERAAGPFVWQNWDKWVSRCDKVVTFIDKQVLSPSPTCIDAVAMQNRGLICGEEWPVFRRTVEKYRKWLDDRYGGLKKIKERLVFAHNDTQYGNILRLVPTGDSPLLLPANQHKQLIVIDFEYSNANMPGYEFANHFIEWTYNYHDPTVPHLCDTARYPSEEEQYRFVRSYVLHRPQFATAASSTPLLNPTMVASPHRSSISSARRSMAIDTSTSLSSMTSESRIPSLTPTTSVGEASAAEREQIELTMEDQIHHLLQETRVWRMACHAQWVAWGIVQARVAGLDENGDAIFSSVEEDADGSDTTTQQNGVTTPTSLPDDARANGQDGAAKDTDADDSEAAEEEFDYLGYAQDRALFFWADCLQFGIVKKEELPEDLVARAMAKVVQR